jgi:MoaA/NifB/PqqE/SkfB family radical SAM enzyme
MINLSTKAQKQLENSHGVNGFSAADFRRISVVPTYQRNSSSNAELGKVWNEKFPNFLKLENFYWLVDRLSNTETIDSLTFIGGEPTLWEDLDKAIYYARKKKIKTILNTNGILHTQKSLPDRVVVNLHTYIDDASSREVIEASLDFYRKKVPLALRLYLREKDKEDSIKLVENLAQKLSLQLDVYPAFSSKDLNCSNCIYSGFTIQPDGNTVSLCNFLPYSAKLGDYLSLREMYQEEFLPKISKQKSCLIPSE